MSEKRKDSKGRVLKDGESQRVNGTYDYRYTDIHKKRRCIYAKSLTELRKKEDELRRDMADGIDYAAGEMTVAELVDRYMNLKRGLKQNSLRSYGSAPIWEYMLETSCSILPNSLYVAKFRGSLFMIIIIYFYTALF